MMKAFIFVTVVACALSTELEFKSTDSTTCSIVKDGNELVATCGTSSVDIIGDIDNIKANMPCDKGFYKQNGNMADTCVACAAADYKSTIGYEACSAHGSCGAGEYYAGGSTIATGSCAACAANSYSDSWTTIFEPCVAHGTCAAGEYLYGASASSAGSCVACPAGTHNADGVGGCNFHGNCPAGQEPSHLEATAASTCQNCAGGKYSASDDRSFCQNWNSCTSTQSLIGESSTSAGTCNNRCTDHYSGMNSDGGGNLIYLDRHTLTCGNNQALGAMGLTRFKLQRNSNGGNYEYAYRCCDVNLNSEAHTSTTSHTTSCSSDGNGQSIYLDRHGVDCGNDKVIAYKRTHRCADPNSNGSHGHYYGVQITYQCRSGATNTCSDHYTGCNSDGNRNVVYFDRHNVQCPTDKPLMRSFRMERCTSNSIRWRYECCA